MVIVAKLLLPPFPRVLLIYRHLATEGMRKLFFLSSFILDKAFIVLSESLHIVFDDGSPDSVLVFLETGAIHAQPVGVIRHLPAAASSLPSLDGLILLLQRTTGNALFAV